MNLHREDAFEADICQALHAQGWLYDGLGDARNFDRNLGLYLPDVLAWVQATQPDAWAALQTSFGTSTAQRLGERLRKLLDDVTGVRCVYPSQGNFLLVRFVDAQAAFDALLDAGVVVRDMRAMAQLGDALRITVGSMEECRRVLSALEALRMEVAA